MDKKKRSIITYIVAAVVTGIIWAVIRFRKTDFYKSHDKKQK